jgi:hypothetical protein
MALPHSKRRRISDADFPREASILKSLISNEIRSFRPGLAFAIYAIAAIFFCVGTTSANAQNSLVQISVDSFHNSSSQHKSEVEPDTYSWGSTMVAAFQVARISSGGGADLGFATSTDGGKTWVHGSLPGLTVNYKKGTYLAASDASIVYNEKYGLWLYSTLPIDNSGVNVAVSRSKDGIHWDDPIPVDNSGNDDKNWITCDNNANSKYYGNCYTEWDEGVIFMSTSTDGGKTWGAAKTSKDQAEGSGAEPLVLPNGTVVVPFLGNNMQGFTSTDGGVSWNTSFLISDVNTFQDNSGLRSSGLPFPSTGIDNSGKLYVVWSDCSFRTNCSTNDIVMSTSTNGTKWTKPVRVPIDPLNSTVDHFIPGLGVDRSSSGHLTSTYMYFKDASCSGDACLVYVGFTTSTDGGKTWTAGKELAGPMNISWLPQTFSGPMLADYLSTSYVNGNPFGVFMVAKAPNGSVLNQAAYTTKDPLLAEVGEPRFSSKGQKPVAHSLSKHWWINFHDVEREPETPPSQPEK